MSGRRHLAFVNNSINLLYGLWQSSTRNVSCFIHEDISSLELKYYTPSPRSEKAIVDYPVP